LVNKERVVVSEGVLSFKLNSFNSLFLFVEYVTVEVDVKNPLQVPLQFTHVHLVGSFQGSTEQVPVHTYKFSFDEFVEFYSPQASNSVQSDQKSLPFRVEPFDILLGPSDTKKVPSPSPCVLKSNTHEFIQLTFAVQPLKAGQLVIKVCDNK
jgi:hypothetical protein